jgi:hypothetical protein
MRGNTQGAPRLRLFHQSFNPGRTLALTLKDLQAPASWRPACTTFNSDQEVPMDLERMGSDAA